MVTNINNRFIAKAHKYKTLLSLISLTALALAGFLALGKPSVADAASPSCAPSTSYGTDTMTINVPLTGSYVTWLRMLSPDGVNDQIMMSIDNGTCYTMGAAMSANTWTWVDTQSGSSTPLEVSLTAGSHTVVLTGNEAGVGIDSLLFTADTTCTPTGTGTNCEPPIPITIPYYLNAGGPSYTDSQGNVWQADTGQYVTQTDTYGSTGGLTTGGDGSTCSTTLANTNCTTHAIAGTTNQEMYQTERWGQFNYAIPISNGNYTVVLDFAEINAGGTERQADVSIEGNAVLTNYDIDGPGNYTAEQQSFNVTVTGSVLNIDISASGNGSAPQLTGLEVLNQSPPSVSISAPTSGASVSGSAVTLTAAASDQVGVQNVQFEVDGTDVGSAVTNAPYTTTWDTTTATNGTHTITAVATNDGGLTATASESVTVSNNNCTGTPTSPSNLHDTDSTPLPANKVDLSWSAGTAAANCTLAGYNIYRGTGAGSLVQINSTPIVGLTYTDSTVAANTAYTYQVTAIDTSSHESAKAPTMPLSVTTGQNCTSGSSNLPTTPTLTATSNYAYTNIPLSWTVSTVSNGCTLAGYHLYRVGTTSPIYTGTAANFTDTGVGLSPANLNSGTAYSYYVQAYDSGGNVSANSTTVSATTEVDNVAPTEPTGLTGNATSSSSISLSWNPSTDLPNPGGVGLTGYYIYRNNATTPTYTVTAPTTTFVDSNVNPSTTYQYAVTAFDKNNNVSAETANVSVTTPAAPLNCTSSSSAPSAPTNLTSPSQTMTTIGLSWSASAPGSGSNCTITGYQIYRAGNLVNTVTSGTTYTDTGLLPSTSYAYMVVAVESNGKQSAAANLTQETAPDTQPPTQPTNFTAVANSPTQVALSWTASTDLFGVTGYILTREHTGSANVVTNLGSTVTSYIDNTVSTSTAYTYTLVAFDAAGNDSTAASTTLTTPAPTCSSNPSAASGLNSSAETSTSVSLSWTASTPAANCSIKGYEIFRGSTDETPNLVTTTSYTNTGLTAYTSYSYTIVAVDSSGHTSAASSALSVTTLTSTGCTTVLIADVLRQCSVNFNDLAAFATDYPKYDVTGVTVQPDTDGDLNDDGLVNFGDLALFAQYYPLENGQ